MGIANGNGNQMQKADQLYASVYFTESCRGVKSPSPISQIPPRILRHVINHTFNTNTLNSPSNLACVLRTELEPTLRLIATELH